MKILKNSTNGIAELDFVIPQSIRLTDIEPTLIYVNERQTAHEIYNFLCLKLPLHEKKGIQIFHALRGDCTKAWILHDFLSGKVKVMICTEALGMVCATPIIENLFAHNYIQGCDFPHISRVIQYLCPESLTSWMQRAGRGGRGGD